MASPDETLLAAILDTERAILEELRGLRAEYARVVSAREIDPTSSSSLSLGGSSRSIYARAGVTDTGAPSPGSVTPRGARATNPLRAVLDAEYNGARRSYERPAEEVVSRLDAIYTETTGRKPLTPPARRLLADAVQVHGPDRTGQLIRDWYRARGTADDLLLYLRTTRDPFGDEAPPAVPASPAVAALGYGPPDPEDDGYPPSALEADDPEDFSGIPLEIPPRPTDPREGPASAAAHPWDRKGFLSGKSTDSRRTA